MFELIFLVLIPGGIIGIAFVLSHLVESSHLRSLTERETQLRDIVVTDLKAAPDPDSIVSAQLVLGQAVLATDYFKSWITGLRALVGGEMGALQTLLTRARREALIRLLLEARRQGAVEVINLRFETSNIMSSTSRNKQAMCAEVFAYGTAIVRRPSDV